LSSVLNIFEISVVRGDSAGQAPAARLRNIGQNSPFTLRYHLSSPSMAGAKYQPRFFLFIALTTPARTAMILLSD
jgi:hypothetical protein